MTHLTKEGGKKLILHFIRRAGPIHHLLTGVSLTDGGVHVVAAGPRLNFNLNEFYSFQFKIHFRWIPSILSVISGMLVLLGSDSNRAVSQILSGAWLPCFKLVNLEYKTLTKTHKLKTDMNQAQRTRPDVFPVKTDPTFQPLIILVWIRLTSWWLRLKGSLPRCRCSSRTAMMSPMAVRMGRHRTEWTWIPESCPVPSGKRSSCSTRVVR